jgi:indole-3-glycerol phosphate synthase
MNVLHEIMDEKGRELEATQQAIPLTAVREAALEARRRATPNLFRAALQRDTINIIAEFKRRSPSKGWIRQDVDPAGTALSYERGGAAAVSVLTEQNRFGGSLDDLRAVRQAISIPVLRKDFVFDEYQVYESAAAGADALLLIVAALSDDELRRLFKLTEAELGMDALVEVHTKTEMERAVASGARIIGVNNRDLRTFEVSIETSVELAQFAPVGATLVSESGLNPDAVARLAGIGYRAFLVGETLMRAEDPVAELQRFRHARQLIGS